ncbi:pyridoxamine 5'-phosphate oxidase family protein [Microbispora sp. GKU 823]|uniref:pyridoxamine 5'-phosphate oxidase family protein n=1 Tax=Microbispora sp. GKU 823 TaxID=1652100 RepID=UPI00211908CA|nr:pyridoxamine 5'-phosphate oxidase family protein [Microbispora sp. GKU 823]
MGKSYERIDGRLRAFIEAQHIFFTATAPLDGEGTVNLSPKGLSGSFAVLDELTVAYLDFAGSNAETIAHLRENGRITLMWCAFDATQHRARARSRRAGLPRRSTVGRPDAPLPGHRPEPARPARDHRRDRREDP